MQISWRHGRTRQLGYDVSTVFFAFYGMTVGWLVYRSTFLPGVLGILLVAGALCYLVFGFADIMLVQ